MLDTESSVEGVCLSMSEHDPSSYCSSPEKRSLTESVITSLIWVFITLGGMLMHWRIFNRYYAHETIQEISVRSSLVSQLIQESKKPLNGFDPFHPLDPFSEEAMASFVENEKGNFGLRNAFQPYKKRTPQGYPIDVVDTEDETDVLGLVQKELFEVVVKQVPDGVCRQMLVQNWTLPYKILVNQHPYYQVNASTLCHWGKNTMRYLFDTELTPTPLETPTSCRNLEYCTGNGYDICNHFTGRCAKCSEFHQTLGEEKRGCTCSADEECYQQGYQYCDEGVCARCPEKMPYWNGKMCVRFVQEAKGCGQDADCPQYFHCSPVLGCVECEANEDCFSLRPYCEMMMHRCLSLNDICALVDPKKPIYNQGGCREILSDADCAALFPDKPAFTGKLCVQCTQNSHCPEATPVCDTKEHTCKTCQDMYHGPDEKNFIYHHGKCVQCTNETHCSLKLPFCTHPDFTCSECENYGSFLQDTIRGDTCKMGYYCEHDVKPEVHGNNSKSNPHTGRCAPIPKTEILTVRDQQDGKWVFIDVPHTWWSAVSLCAKLGGRLPSREELCKRAGDRKELCALDGPWGDISALLKRKEATGYTFKTDIVWTRDDYSNVAVYAVQRLGKFGLIHLQDRSTDARMGTVCYMSDSLKGKGF